MEEATSWVFPELPVQRGSLMNEKPPRGESAVRLHVWETHSQMVIYSDAVVDASSCGDRSQRGSLKEGRANQRQGLGRRGMMTGAKETSQEQENWDREGTA